MAKAARIRVSPPAGLPKVASGIRGLDQITQGGLPRGRATLVTGGSGTGKTLLGIEFLVRGAVEHGEPGVFVAFEERPEELARNTDSLGFNLERLIAGKKLFIDQIVIDRSETSESGAYNLDGLFIRLNGAIEAVGAKRVVLDSIEALFASLADADIVRSELRRLFRWLKDKGVTTIVTGEQGEGAISRHQIEEFVSDCVIVLDQRITEQVATRRLRVLKYRGSMHGANEFPFLIDRHGLRVLPMTATLDYPVANQFISSGLPELDRMLGGKGYFRGSAVLISGTAGTGKSSIAAHFVDAACRSGERCMYFAFEEAPAQIMRNMRSIGIDLQKWVTQGLLKFSAARAASLEMEGHLSLILNGVEDFNPRSVVIDAESSFAYAGTVHEVRSMMVRSVDLLKARQITSLFTSLVHGSGIPVSAGVSSLIDTWLSLRNLEQGGELIRGLHIIKSRGMKQSNQVREILFTDHGLQLQPVQVGPDGVVTGSARLAQEATEHDAAARSLRVIKHKNELLARRKAALVTSIAKLQSAFQDEAHDLDEAIAQERLRQLQLESGRATLTARRRQAASPPRRGGNGHRR